MIGKQAGELKTLEETRLGAECQVRSPLHSATTIHFVYYDYSFRLFISTIHFGVRVPGFGFRISDFGFPMSGFGFREHLYGVVGKQAGELKTLEEARLGAEYQVRCPLDSSFRRNE